MLYLYDFSVDYVINPALIKTSGLRFGWKLSSDAENVTAASYHLEIAEADTEKTVFDSGNIASSALCDITFPSLTLQSKTDYVIRVAVTANTGETATYAHKTATEILPEDWGDAQWIKPKRHIVGWAPYLRTKFETRDVKKAVLYACGLGVADYTVNGKAVDAEAYIDPPIANYERTVFYRRFDITELLCDGGNCLAVLLGEGFYSQSRVWGREGMVYGDVCAKIRLEIFHTDGTVTTVVSDTENWKYQYSPYTVNNIYGGETYDARLEIPDYADYTGSEDGWGAVVTDETPKGVLTPCLFPPVRVMRTLPAKSVHCVSGVSDGSWVFDIGENMAGTAEFHLPPSPRGAVYVFRYAEAVNAQGGIDVRSSGAFATQCIQEDIYIARGDEQGEVYRPHLCYHGFRYVEVSGVHDLSAGYGKMPETGLVCGIALSTAFDKTASFHCSDKDLDTLMRVMENTYRSNFHGIPEDCPAREKCGWLGDAQIVCNYGLLNYDSTTAYEKYMNDVRTTNDVYGVWQMIAPGKRGCGEATPLWGCAQVLIPYYMWKYKGDREAVTDNFDLMEAWVQHECNRADDSVISEGLGDWCPPEGHDHPRRIPVVQSSTFMFFEICVRMEELCRAFSIGNADYYRDLAEKIKDSAVRHFYDFRKHSFGYHASDAAALETGLIPDGEGDALAHALIASVVADDYAMHTGIYGNKYLVPAMYTIGCGDMAMKLLFNREHPSFGTMLDDGATSMWESPDMQFIAPADKGVSSYNHPMHGGFLYFVTTHLAGIQPLVPGFAHIGFAPCRQDRIASFSLSAETPYGCVTVVYEDGAYILSVPAGATAEITRDGAVLDGEAYAAGTVIGSGKHTVSFTR